MQSLKKQKGLTTISWLVIIIVAGFLIYVAMKIIPVYIDHYAVKATLESVKNDSLSARKSKKEIRDMIMRKLDVNNIRHITRDHLSVKRSGKVTRINITYEERRPIVHNISLVMSFEEDIELTSN
ncbi:MAG: DUF4845 domain-containing protein [Candidatus Thiodiazotropha sp. (ex Ctena orbiculata)]|uniref:DUF4845 domain-containing protein n=1 Tax=Candidatus Thiodiazotropha taylori TaxID=2792791 RepID=A0A944MA47_9GAMM|nr:DUF4845 domain-containing protein [Candidatus Thiodiazotropha taylori]MBV2138638.1 DUF4845 domain-containing protein [Candidatus Thiodiazotropha taylori]